MHHHIALLRGVNVGGHNKLPMADLRQALNELGFADPQTYIQSGNVVFLSDSGDTEVLATQISRCLREQFGLDVPVFVLSAQRLQHIRDANPFSAEPEADKALQLFFLRERASAPKLEKLQALKAPSEDFSLTEACFYLWAPQGIGRSKLAAAAETLLGVATTTRNWRSVNKLLEMTP